MVIPDIVLAIALLSFFSLLNVTMGLQTIIIAHVVFNLAFVCRWCGRGSNPSTGRSSRPRKTSARRLTTFRRVTLPVILPAIVAGALLAFTLSVDEFIIAFFTAGRRTGLDHAADADLFDDPLRRHAGNQRARPRS
jgi:spermidine/putrescine transport system permease protein